MCAWRLPVIVVIVIGTCKVKPWETLSRGQCLFRLPPLFEIGVSLGGDMRSETITTSDSTANRICSISTHLSKTYTLQKAAARESHLSLPLHTRHHDVRRRLGEYHQQCISPADKADHHRPRRLPHPVPGLHHPRPPVKQAGRPRNRRQCKRELLASIHQTDSRPRSRSTPTTTTTRCRRTARR